MSQSSNSSRGDSHEEARPRDRWSGGRQRRREHRHQQDRYDGRYRQAGLRGHPVPHPRPDQLLPHGQRRHGLSRRNSAPENGTRSGSALRRAVSGAVFIRFYSKVK